MKREKKVLVIGLDGATFDLIEPWVAEGKLPALAGLMKRGSWGNLISTVQNNSANAWSTFITGVNAGKHGLFHFIRPIPGSYNVQFTNASLRDGKSLWKVMSECGLRVGVINVPMTYPPEPVNGFLVAGMDSPGIDSDFVYPPEVLDELHGHVNGYILEAGVTGFIRRGRPDLALKRMYKAIDVRLRAALYLMKEKEWDFFMIVFTESDRVQHFFWKYINIHHPNYNQAKAKKYGPGIFSIYARLDDAVARLIDRVGEETTVFVMSDHGAGPSSHRTCYINKWLEAEEYLKFKSAGRTKDMLHRWKAAILRTTNYYLSARLPRNVKETLVRLLPGVRDRVSSVIYLSNIDWRKTRAYSRENAPEISLNLKGREPEGIVEPESYERLTQEIIQKLLAVKCPDTGEPIVSQVHRKEDVYSGPLINFSPDLFIEWNKYRYIQRPSFVSKVDGFIEVLEGRELARAERMTRPSGIHRPDGILICRGNSVKEGNRIEPASLMDLNPTILYSLGLPIPEAVEGKVIEHLFKPELLAKNPIRIEKTEKESTLAEHKDSYTVEENEIIRERLSGLGYID